MIVGVTGLFLAGRGGWHGWAIGLAAQVLWFAYAIVTKQYGFIVSAIAYGWVNIVNIKKALKRRREADEK
jgi:hypothetical protein